MLLLLFNICLVDLIKKSLSFFDKFIINNNRTLKTDMLTMKLDTFSQDEVLLIFTPSSLYRQPHKLLYKYYFINVINII